MTADRSLDAVWRGALVVASSVLLVGLALALGGWRPAAWIMVAAVTGGVAANVTLSFVKYRRTMHREWPRVEPLGDD